MQPHLTGNQLIVADVSGSGTISSFDAGQVARWVVSSPPSGSTGNWIFSPVNRTYPTVTGNVASQDYAALLMGEVTGNWIDTPSRPARGADRSVVVKALNMSVAPNNEVIVPVVIDGAADRNIIAYEFDLRFDPSVLQPQKEPVDVSGTASRGLSAVSNTETEGLLKVAVYGPMPIAANGVLFNLKLRVVGTVGAVSPLVFERMMLNEGEPAATVTNGEITISTDKAEIVGRLLNSKGHGLPNARVTITDVSGQFRSVVSNSFGYYRFENLHAGQTYTISVKSRNWAFSSRDVVVTEQFTNADLIAGR